MQPDVTIAQRVSLGRDARTRVPRSSHGSFEPPTDRADPIGLLEQQAASRVPELIPIRYERMSASAFAFFRGAALIMASDLAATPTSGLTVQLCGDAHISNFGLFASPERQLVFDINDFDETLPGPWEWDVKRFAASLHIAATDNGAGEDEARSVVLAGVARYRTAMAEFAAMSNLAVWYAYLPAETLLARVHNDLNVRTAKMASRALAKAKSRDHLQSYSKLVDTSGEQIRFISDPPLLVRMDELLDDSARPQMAARIQQGFADYRQSLSADRRSLLDQFRPVELARKVVGVGSVGTRAWVMLMVGRDSTDPLFLQLKEAQRSVLEQFVAPTQYDNCGHRVVAGQRTMQANSDILLGWNRLTGLDGLEHDFYVRQLHDWKGSADIDQMSPDSLSSYGAICGWTLARAHARSGDRVAIAAYLGSGSVFDQAIADFAAAYAQQNQRDYGALLAATASGRLPSHTDSA
jgi:uncharacterized protein (DUF2252 family)